MQISNPESAQMMSRLFGENNFIKKCAQVL